MTKSRHATFQEESGNQGTSSHPNSKVSYNVQSARGSTIKAGEGANEFLAVSAVSAQFPYSFYAIDARNNEITWSWTGSAPGGGGIEARTNVVMTLRSGNYNPQQLLEEINYHLRYDTIAQTNSVDGFEQINQHRFVTVDAVLDDDEGVLTKPSPKTTDGSTWEFAPSNSTSHDPITGKYKATFFAHSTQHEAAIEFTITAKGGSAYESFPYDQLGLVNNYPKDAATYSFKAALGALSSAVDANIFTYNFYSDHITNEYSDEMSSIQVRCNFLNDGGEYGRILQKIPVANIESNTIHFTANAGGLVHLISQTDLQNISLDVVDGSGRFMDFNGRHWSLTLQFTPITLDPVSLPTRTDPYSMRLNTHRRKRIKGLENAHAFEMGGDGGGGGPMNASDYTNDAELNQTVMDGPTRMILNPYLQ